LHLYTTTQYRVAQKTGPPYIIANILKIPRPVYDFGVFASAGSVSALILLRKWKTWLK